MPKNCIAYIRLEKSENQILMVVFEICGGFNSKQYPSTHTPKNRHAKERKTHVGRNKRLRWEFVFASFCFTCLVFFLRFIKWMKKKFNIKKKLKHFQWINTFNVLLFIYIRKSFSIYCNLLPIFWLEFIERKCSTCNSIRLSRARD